MDKTVLFRNKVIQVADWETTPNQPLWPYDDFVEEVIIVVVQCTVYYNRKKRGLMM